MTNQPVADPVCRTPGQQQEQRELPLGQHVQMSLSDDIFNGGVCDRVSDELAEQLRKKGAPSS